MDATASAPIEAIGWPSNRWIPRHPGIFGLPYAAIDCPEVVGRAIARNARHCHHPSAAKRTDHPPLHAAEHRPAGRSAQSREHARSNKQDESHGNKDRTPQNRMHQIEVSSHLQMGSIRLHFAIPVHAAAAVTSSKSQLIGYRCVLNSLVSYSCSSFLSPTSPKPRMSTPSRSPRCAGATSAPFVVDAPAPSSGVPSQPNVFYVGAVNGGVWKTNDFGRTWQPIFDQQPTGSIGAIVVAPSDPQIVYVGSGEGLHRPDLSVGDGIYKSTDAGATWTHLGLRDGQQISQMAVDPRDPNRLFVAVAGHPYGPNPERGIYRSTDGGKTFEKVLYKNENIGAAGVVIDPSDPNIVYATLWEAREGPWENGEWNGTGGGIFKSTDGGQTWKQLAGGLPDGIVQAYVSIAPAIPSVSSLRSPPKTRSISTLRRRRCDLAHRHHRPASQERIGGGDLPVPMLDPKNPDVVYMTSTVTWKSTDGGKTWTGFRGAPGGDDYQNIWINPNDPNIILIASDQGAIVTVNGGESWSSWYNQPTAQMYHVSADNAFPYRLCSGQQESGSVCISSRGNDGEITFRDWHPVAAEEYGYVAPDPLDPDIVYGGKLTRYDRRTAQAQYIMPVALRTPDFRVVRTEPVVFSPVDPHLLYFAANTLWTTRDGGQSWKQISPDLTRKTWDVPASVGIFAAEPSAKPTQRGVIYALAPSPLDINRIWAGTDDGLIWLTTDGGTHWNNITPPTLTAWQKVSVLEASHSDPNTAYAAINTLRLDDLRPHILRTRDSRQDLDGDYRRHSRQRKRQRRA